MDSVFDKLITSRPVDGAAARVLSKGVHYKPDNVIARLLWTAPPKLEPIPVNLRATPKFEDLTGRKFGRFIVAGYLGKPLGEKQKQPCWLVRCSCGDYETRTARAIRNPQNAGDRCENCRHLAYLKRTDSYLRNPAAPQPLMRDI